MEWMVLVSMQMVMPSDHYDFSWPVSLASQTLREGLARETILLYLTAALVTTKKGHRDCRKSTGNKLRYITLCASAITVLHECWMQDTPTSHSNLVTI